MIKSHTKHITKKIKKLGFDNKYYLFKNTTPFPSIPLMGQEIIDASELANKINELIETVNKLNAK